MTVSGKVPGDDNECKQKQMKELHYHNYQQPPEKTDLRGFRPGPTQSDLYNHRRLEARNFGFNKLCCVERTKALIIYMQLLHS